MSGEEARQGTHTWAKNLPGLDRSVREAVALVEGLPDDAEAGLRLDYDYDIGDPELNAVTARLRAERERIQREERQLAEQTAAVAAQLTELSMSVRDAAALLAVSPQRISQVARPDPRRTGNHRLAAPRRAGERPGTRRSSHQRTDIGPSTKIPGINSTKNDLKDVD